MSDFKKDIQEDLEKEIIEPKRRGRPRKNLVKSDETKRISIERDVKRHNTRSQMKRKVETQYKDELEYKAKRIEDTSFARYINISR